MKDLFTKVLNINHTAQISTSLIRNGTDYLCTIYLVRECVSQRLACVYLVYVQHTLQFMICTYTYSLSVPVHTNKRFARVFARELHVLMMRACVHAHTTHTHTSTHSSHMCTPAQPQQRTRAQACTHARARARHAETYYVRMHRN